jgi:hypothetical protein
MPYAQLNNLDFQQIKQTLKDYLKANSANGDLLDYDYEGSVINNLLDLLAYNTYYTAFNTNMVANEIFLESATLRDNVVSLAKQLGYRPRSITSPSTTIDFNVAFEGTVPPSAILRAGSAFTTIFDDSAYQYSVIDDVRTSVTNGVAEFRNVLIKEGTYVTTSFTVNESSTSQRFILRNQGIDTSTIRVRVYSGQNNTSYTLYQAADNILNLSATSLVYFISEIEDEQYELIFGDGVFGRKLENNEFVEITYLTTTGPASNGANSFVFNGILEDESGNIFTTEVSIVGVPENTSGGEEIESINKIKKNAPKVYSAQERAVTKEDYAALIRKIYPATSDVYVYGGEDEMPPEYGTVKIVVKPRNAESMTPSTKRQILENLKKYSVASVRPFIVDPSILYIELTSNIFYNSSSTTKTSEVIRSLVIEVLENYLAVSETEKFNGKFRYSKVVGSIDNADASITSNLTEVRLRKDFYPIVNTPSYYEICFQNSLDVECDTSTVYSTGFVTREYPNDTVYLEDRGGVMVIYKLDSQTKQKVVLNPDVGYVDYKKGEIKLFNLTIIKGSYSTNKIEIRVIPRENDILAKRECYLDVDISKSTFTVRPE